MLYSASNNIRKGIDMKKLATILCAAAVVGGSVQAFARDVNVRVPEVKFDSNGRLKVDGKDANVKQRSTLEVPGVTGANLPAVRTQETIQGNTKANILDASGSPKISLGGKVKPADSVTQATNILLPKDESAASVFGNKCTGIPGQYLNVIAAAVRAQLVDAKDSCLASIATAEDKAPIKLIADVYQAEMNTMAGKVFGSLSVYEQQNVVRAGVSVFAKGTNTTPEDGLERYRYTATHCNLHAAPVAAVANTL